MKTQITLLFCLIMNLGFAQENTALTCADGIDNDGDGLIDCLDDDCANLPNDGCATCGDGNTFADAIIEYVAGCPTNQDTFPESTLGVSDYDENNGDTYLYLGEGGYVKLRFTNNVLTNSGSSDDDLYVFEIGPLVEDCTLAFRPADSFTEIQLTNAGIPDANGDGFYEFGAVGGSTAGYDIDDALPGYGPGELLFDAIEITDVVDLSCPANTPGADIDAVCALSSQPLSVKEESIQFVEVYPNPTSGNITVTFDDLREDVKIKVLNVLGQTVYNYSLKTASPFSFSLENNPKGIYFLKINSGNMSATKKIIKK